MLALMLCCVCCAGVAGEVGVCVGGWQVGLAECREGALHKSALHKRRGCMAVARAAAVQLSATAGACVCAPAFI